MSELADKMHFLKVLNRKNGKSNSCSMMIDENRVFRAKIKGDAVIWQIENIDRVVEIGAVNTVGEAWDKFVNIRDDLHKMKGD